MQSKTVIQGACATGVVDWCGVLAAGVAVHRAVAVAAVYGFGVPNYRRQGLIVACVKTFM